MEPETVGKLKKPEKKYIIVKASRMSNKRQLMEKGLTYEQAKQALSKYKSTAFYYYIVLEQLFSE